MRDNDEDGFRRPSLMPTDTPDYMAPAWASCMSWALSEDTIRATFEAETGLHYVPPKTGLERMIDNATGHGDTYVKAFVEWANENVWGPMDGDDDADDGDHSS